jgi:hypothetical protein
VKFTKTILALVTGLAMGVVSEGALAQHNHGGGHGGWHGGWHGSGHVGVYIGAPFVWPGYYGYGPYYGYNPYYYPPVVTAPAAPTTYIEQSQDQEPNPDQNSGYWYYCPDSKTYYPYVKQCASSWQQVAPQPPPQ